MVDAVPAQYKHTLFRGRVSMAFPATNDQYATPQIRRPLRFKAALSGSTTKCGIVYGMWKRRSAFLGLIDTRSCVSLPQISHIYYVKFDSTRLSWTVFTGQKNIMFA